MNNAETFERFSGRRRPVTDADADFRDLPAGGDQIAVRLPPIAQYMRIAMRWKWLILGITAAAVVIALIATLLMTPLYTATASIEIARESDRVLKTEGVEREATTADQEFYQTQYGLLKSRAIAERVARDLKLGQNKAFLEAYGIAPQPARVNPRDAAARITDIGHILLGSVSVDPVRASRLVQISFTSPNPEVSAMIANQWGRSFIQTNLERRYDATAYARKFLENRLAQLRQQIEESERNLVNYAGQQRIVNVPGITVTGQAASTSERPLIADRLATLNNELGAATADRVKAESRIGGGTTPESLQNAGIAALRARRAEASAEYAKLMAQFEPGYPPAKALASQISQLDASIAREEGRVNQSLRQAYSESVRREQDLTSRVNSTQAGLLDLRRRSIQYNIYQREVDTNRELYDGLLQRYKEVGVAAGVGTNNVSVVDTAEVPGGPSKPRMMVNLMIALMLGLAAGVLAALALEQIDEAITDPTDVEPNLGLPLLGVVPHTGETNIVDALKDRKSPAAEAYLSVQTNLEFSTEHGVPKSFSVTSTRPAEGKSSTVYALALSLVRSQRKVVLIDGDMRSPSVHHNYGLDNSRGLSNFLTGSDDIASLLRASPENNLTLMTAGPQPPNAAELLTGPRLHTLIERLLETYDHVVIDSPPVMGLADAPLIAAAVEASVYAVESHGTRARLIKVAINRLAAANAHIVGVVLTKFESRSARFGYGYGYDYGYGYGRKDDAKV